jgi:hypothetical protein
VNFFSCQDIIDRDTLHAQSEKQTIDFCNEIDVWYAKEELWTLERK